MWWRPRVTVGTSACDENHSNLFSQVGTVSQMVKFGAANPNTLQVAAEEPRLVLVTRVRVTLAVGAVLLWAVTPALACLLPCLATTPAKQECSHHMVMHCGRSMMAAGRTCCQVSSRPELVTVETQVGQSQKRVLAIVPVVARVCAPEVRLRTASMAFFESPPPEAHPLSSSVLRI